VATIKVEYCHDISAPVCIAFVFEFFSTVLEPHLFSESLSDVFLYHYLFVLITCKMESEDGENTNKKMDEANARYLRLHAIVEDIKSGSITRTADWYADQDQLLNIYDSHFGDFTGIHPEIEDPIFRENCQVLNDLIVKLLREYVQYRWFNLYDYLKFNQTLIVVVDYVFAITDTEDELGAIFNGMTV